MIVNCDVNYNDVKPSNNSHRRMAMHSGPFGLFFNSLDVQRSGQGCNHRSSTLRASIPLRQKMDMPARLGLLA